jgi:hypothetical protein
MNSAAPFVIMCLVTLMLGLDAATLTSVVQEALVRGGTKDNSATGLMVVYVTHMLAFVGMCYATYKVHKS